MSSTICFYNIVPETTRPSALIFGMEHCLVDLYQVCSNGASQIQNGPAVEGFGFENKIFLTSSSPEPQGSGT